MELSVLIAARNEEWLSRTIAGVIENSGPTTEVIAVLDGAWAKPEIQDHERVTLIHLPSSIGQRAAVNLAARASDARYVMKLDAHCIVDKDFDRKLIDAGEELGRDVTQIARMYNLHAFDWVYKCCGHRTYQGPTPKICPNCKSTAGPFEREIKWTPRWHKRTDFARFDSDLHFQYWGEYEKRDAAQGDICDLMTSVGAMFFMRRDRFWELGGLDESHGSWGQFGVEVALKSWLSGGRHVVNKRTWFAHLFRTQGGDFSFPYHLSQSDVERARKYSQDLWRKGTWPQAVRTLEWVLDKFAPVPTWHDMAPPQLPPSEIGAPAIKTTPTKGLVYYSDCRGDATILTAVRQNLKRIARERGMPIVSVTLDPVELGKNVVLPLERGYLTMFKQILRGLGELQTDIAFLVEHDVLYAREHFDFTPRRSDLFYYNQAVWRVDASSGHALFYYVNQTSGLCANRDLLLQHYERRVERVEREGFQRAMGFEPGTHQFPRGVDNYGHDTWMASVPNLDIRHAHNLTPSRWRKDQFRNQKYTDGWTEADAVPGWGRMSDGGIQRILAELATE